MRGLAFIAIVVFIGVGICESANLAEITFADDINSLKLLRLAFKTNVKVIDADVVLGKHTKSPLTRKPIIDQHNRFESDFSLEEFITHTIQYNKKHEKDPKAIKLNFFSIEAVQQSVDILLSKHKQIKFPIHLNANVLKGPGGAGSSAPINGKQFIEQVKKMDNVVLSLGWYTYWSKNSKQIYSKKNIEDMENLLEESQITTNPDYKDIALNFPINAAFAVKSDKKKDDKGGKLLSLLLDDKDDEEAETSKKNLKEFYDNLKKTNPQVTYTLESKRGEVIDPKNVKDFIMSYGVENVYVDLPDEIREKLDLGNSAPTTGNTDKPATGSASSLVKFSVLNVLALLVVAIFRN